MGWPCDGLAFHRGGRMFLVFQATEPGISAGLTGHLVRMQTLKIYFTFYFRDIKLDCYWPREYWHIASWRAFTQCRFEWLLSFRSPGISVVVLLVHEPGFYSLLVLTRMAWIENCYRGSRAWGKLVPGILLYCSSIRPGENGQQEISTN